MTGCIQAISAKQIRKYARLQNTVRSVNGVSALTDAIIRKRVYFSALNGQLAGVRNLLHSIAVTESDLRSQRGRAVGRAVRAARRVVLRGVNMTNARYVRSARSLMHASTPAECYDGRRRPAKAAIRTAF